MRISLMDFWANDSLQVSVGSPVSHMEKQFVSNMTKYCSKLSHVTLNEYEWN